MSSQPLSCWRLLRTGALLLSGLAAFSQTPGLYDQAASAVGQGSADRAIPILENLLASSPRDIKARNLLGIALMTLNRRAEADAEFKEALSISPKFIPALKNLALNEFAMSRQAEAETDFKKILELAPNDPVAHLYLAEIAFAKKQYGQALSLYEASAGQESKDPLISFHFSETLLKLGQADKAEAVIEHLPNDAPAAIHFQTGVALASAGRYVAAAKQFEAAQSGYPDPYAVGFNLVLTEAKARDFNGAIRAGEQLLTAGFQRSELYNLLATAYEQTGRTQEAYDALRKATQIDPTDETNYLDLIALALQHQNLELSLQIAEVGLSHLPGSYRIQLEKGAVLALAGRPTDAEAEFLKATRTAPKTDASYIALAMVKIQSGKLAEAIELLRSRRTLHPDDYLVNLYLGEALSRKGFAPNTTEEQEAEHALTSAERANPQSATPHLLNGKLLFARGDLARAAREFENALRLNPQDASPAYQLALIYRKQGDKVRADSMFELFSRSKQAEKDDSVASNLLDVVRSPSH